MRRPGRVQFVSLDERRRTDQVSNDATKLSSDNLLIEAREFALQVSATDLAVTFGAAPMWYALWLDEPCSSTVLVHLILATDSSCCIKVSSDRICFTPANFRDRQLVGVEACENGAHYTAITHRVYSLDPHYDRINAPEVRVKTKWSHPGSFYSLGGPVSKRKAVSAMTTVNLLGAVSDKVESDDVSKRESSMIVTHMAAGCNFSVVSVTNGSESHLLSWGVNPNGELGMGTTTSIVDPQPISMLPMQVHGELIGIIQISCGKHHVAVVTTQARLFTWGSNKFGQLGHGDYFNRFVPFEVQYSSKTCGKVQQHALRIRHTIMERVGPNVTRAICGAYHSLFVTDQQQLWSMGYNQAGQLGIGHRLQQHQGWRSCTPIAVADLSDRSILDVAAGQNHSACVLSNGDVYVWGCGDDGRLGLGRDECKLRPTILSKLKEAKIRGRSVRCGARHTALISDMDLLYVWGANEFGQLGCGDKSARQVPCIIEYPPFVSEGVVDISLGEFHSACITLQGKAFIWGLDLTYGSMQLDTRMIPTKAPLLDSERARKVCCGWTQSCIWTHMSVDVHDGPQHQASYRRIKDKQRILFRRDELAHWRAIGCIATIGHDIEGQCVSSPSSASTSDMTAFRQTRHRICPQHDNVNKQKATDNDKIVLKKSVKTIGHHDTENEYLSYMVKRTHSEDVRKADSSRLDKNNTYQRGHIDQQCASNGNHSTRLVGSANLDVATDYML